MEENSPNENRTRKNLSSWHSSSRLEKLPVQCTWVHSLLGLLVSLAQQARAHPLSSKSQHSAPHTIHQRELSAQWAPDSLPPHNTLIGQGQDPRPSIRNYLQVTPHIQPWLISDNSETSPSKWTRRWRVRHHVVAKVTVSQFPLATLRPNSAWQLSDTCTPTMHVRRHSTSHKLPFDAFNKSPFKCW